MKTNATPRPIIMMFPRTPREFVVVSLYLGLGAYAMTSYIGVTDFWVVVTCLAMILLSTIAIGIDGIMASYIEPVVDIWNPQRHAMAASGQDLPDAPSFTSGSALYGALILEEVGETMEAMMNIMTWNCHTDEARKELRILLGQASSAASISASRIRKQIANTGPFAFNLSMDQAVELLDGLTDTAVVVAGASLATGLPGQRGYLEVSRSNLSKIDPSTNRIEKDPSGKWIKGPNYKPPQLDLVIQRHWEEAIAGSDDGYQP